MLDYLFGMGSYSLLLILLGVSVALAVASAILMRVFGRSSADIRPAPGDFSPVHKGKAFVGGCKFDADEEKRTRFHARPPIDTSNLPAPDARVVAQFALVNPTSLTEALKKLSGETAAVVGGKTITIASRNSFSGGVSDAMSWVEEFYKANGIPVEREPYKVSGRTYYNLVATIKGTENPDKVLILGAHLDSTAGRTGRSEPVAPGADDDGSGTVGLMTVALALKNLPLSYTVRCVHFTGEEQGLWGSYAHSDKVSRAKTDLIAMFEMDMIGYCAKPGNRVDIHDGADKNGSHQLVVSFVRNVKRYGLNLNAVDTHNHEVDDRSDHAGFLDHGYKAVLVSEEFTEGEDGGFNPAYHSLDDRVKLVNVPYMCEVIKAMIATAFEYASSTAV